MSRGDTIKCPWCDAPIVGHQFQDEEYHHDGEEDEIDCAECGKPINITTHVSISFSVDRGAE